MEILDALLRDHGLFGLLIGFLILGPGYTLVRTRNLRVELAGEAQRLLNQYMREEMVRADVLEERLQQTSDQLQSAHRELFTLKLQFAQATYQLEEWGDLRQEVTHLRERVVELEGQVATQKEANRGLREQIEAKADRIQELEQLLPTQTDTAFKNTQESETNT